MEVSLLSLAEQKLFEDFYWAQKAPEVQQHQGQLVVVHNKRVIAAGLDEDALLAQASAQENCPEEDLVVVVVPRADLQEIPH